MTTSSVTVAVTFDGVAFVTERTISPIAAVADALLRLGLSNGNGTKFSETEVLFDDVTLDAK